VALHALDQHRQQHLEPLAADTIDRLLQQRGPLPHRLVVDPLTRPRQLRHKRAMQCSPRVLAVIASYLGEFIEDLAALPLILPPDSVSPLPA
jgi:hypothetical protein